eukprot:gene9632-1853_t
MSTSHSMDTTTENCSLSSIEAIIERAEANVISISDAVRQLGPFLTSTEGAYRTKATQALAALADHQSLEQVKNAGSVLLQFFCDRLDDHPSTTPCLRGLLAMARRGAVTKDEASLIVNHIFQKLFVQAQVLTIRQLVFQLEKNLLESFGAYLSRTLGEKFVAGFIQQIDGEKDPRCLVIIFYLVPFIASTFPISKYANDLFDVTSCYFPITFTPPPNDPYGVSPQQLIEGLRKCMSASPEFAHPCMELLLDKSASTIDDTKAESLITIAHCIEAFGYSHVQPFLNQLYLRIRREIFENLAPQVQQAALSALAACARILDTHAACSEFINPILAEARHHLSDLDSNSISIHGKMLIALAAAAPISCIIIFEEFVPQATERFYEMKKSLLKVNVTNSVIALNLLAVPMLFHAAASETDKQSAVGGVLAGLCQGAQKSSISKLDCAADVVEVVRTAEDVITKFITCALSSSSDHLQAMAARAFTALGSMKVWTDEELMGHLDATCQLCQRTSNSLTREAMSEGSRLLSNTRHAAADYVARSSLAALSSAVEPREFIEHLQIVDAAVSSEAKPIFVIKFLLKLLYFPPTESELLEWQRTSKAIATTLKRILSRSNTQANNVAQSAFEMIDMIIQETFYALSSPMEKHRVVFIDTTCGSVLGLGVSAVCQRLESNACDVLVNKCADLFCTPDNDGRTLLSKVCSQNTELPTLLWILPAVVGTLHREQSLSLAHRLTRECLVSSVLLNSSWAAAVPVCSLYAAILNKFNPQTSEDMALKEKDLDIVVGPIRSGLSSDTSCSTGAQCLFSYVAKALVMKRDPASEAVVELLFDMLQNPTLSEGACLAIRVILQEDDVVLHRGAHTHFLLMYRQRFFQENISRIVELFESTTNVACLKALSYLLKGVPLQVVKTELPVVLPLLLQSMHLEDSQLLEGTLDTVLALVIEVPSQVAEHMDALISRCLDLTQHPKLVVRKAALELLSALVHLPTHMAVRYKTKVIRALQAALDDRKRVVRAAAVQASTVW